MTALFIKKKKKKKKKQINKKKKKKKKKKILDEHEVKFLCSCLLDGCYFNSRSLQH